MADLSTAKTTREGAVERGTHEKQSRAWRRWTTYCESIGLEHNLFLDEFTRHQRIKIFGAFAVALREGRFSKRANGTMASKSVKSSIDLVAATFRENGYGNPTRDEDLDTAFLLQRQYRALAKGDAKEKQQKALPVDVIRTVAHNQTTETTQATAQLIIGAFFFACRSCEYLKVSRPGQTKQLRIRNLQFARNGTVIPNTSPNLNEADCVSITFEMQKNDMKHETVTQWATNDLVMCPVRAWAAIVSRILKYKGATEETHVSAVWRKKKIEYIDATTVISALQVAVKAYGESALGIEAHEIGTHSLRSGAAMAMYLGGCPVYSIMLIGRWRSTAFLQYIRKQIAEFTFDVSQKMLTVPIFRHVLPPTKAEQPAATSMQNIVGRVSSLMLAC